MKKSIITILGARPQFIKASTISNEFKKYPYISEIIIHTGQHYDSNMSDIFFHQLKIPISYNLGIGGGLHGQNTGRMIEKIEKIIISKKPKGVLVYGDTDSTLAGAISATKLNIPVWHVEAGLRSYNRFMPEELNRILTDKISDLLFTPCKNASDTLLKEGIDKRKIHQVGDVMYDLFLFYENKLSELNNYLKNKKNIYRDYLLLTVHRAENVDSNQKLKILFSALSSVKYKIIFPIHPRTKNRIKKLGLHIPENIDIRNPVGYLEMLALQRNAKIILTDSGGIQKEAYFNKKPCITLREETEWIELTMAGVNNLTGINSKKIKDAIRFFENFSFSEVNAEIYGDGHASNKIVDIIKKNLYG